MTTSRHYEVIIVGGGMIGSCAAAALALHDIDVALVDTARPQLTWPEHSVDLRVSALTRASQNILSHVGAWPFMNERGLCAYRDMRVWDGEANGELHFDCADTEFDALGHIVENRVTVAALWSVMQTLPSLNCLVPSTVTEVNFNGDRAQLRLADGQQLTTDLVIAADGAASSLRQLAGIEVAGWPYRQQAVVTTVSTEKPHQATAWQRFLPEGPIAFLPLRNGQCSIVWTVGKVSAEQLLQCGGDEFRMRLQHASGDILGKILSVDSRAAFPLRFQYAKRYVGRHIALIGDAAHTMHPLAGQGANAGLLDAAALVELIVKRKRLGKPLSGQKYLRQYERWRKGDNLAMITAMDLLNKTFTHNRSLTWIYLRSMGMNVINHQQVFKRLFNNYAMGLRADLPQMAYTSAPRDQPVLR